MKSVRVVIISALLSVTGCAGLKIQVPGVQVGGNSSNSGSSGGGLISSGSSRQVDLSTPKQGHATVSNPNDLGDMEHDLAMGRGPSRLADCDKTKADKNAVQPTEDEQGHLQKGLGMFPHNILNIEPRIAGLKAVPEYEKLVADSQAKFGPWWCSAEYQGGPGVSAHENQTLKLMEAIAMFKKSEWGDPAQSKKEFDRLLSEADTKLADYQKAKVDRLPERGDSLRSSSNEVQMRVNQWATYYYEQLKMMNGEQNADVVAMKSKLDASNAKIAQAITDIDNAMAESFPMPKDEYKGKDAPAVKAAFAKYFSDKKVLTVVLTTDWDRKKGADWVGNSLVNYDHSWIHGKIITKADDKNGEVWEVIARKDHLDGDKIKFDTYVPSNLGKIRLAHVKK
ncbi:MAG: hypothetical protein ACJ790_00305 [Myxococcaceae bacterium]